MEEGYSGFERVQWAWQRPFSFFFWMDDVNCVLVVLHLTHQVSVEQLQWETAHQCELLSRWLLHEFFKASPYEEFLNSVGVSGPTGTSETTIKIVHSSKLWKCIAVHGRNLLLTLIMQKQYFCHPFRTLPASIKQPAITTHDKYTGSLENRSEEAWRTSNPTSSYGIRAGCSGYFPVRPWSSPRLHSLCGWPLIFFTVVFPCTYRNLLFQLQPVEMLVSCSSHTLWWRAWLHLLRKHLPGTGGCCLVPPNLCSGLSQPRSLSLHHSPSWGPLAKLTSQIPHCSIVCHVKTKNTPPKALNTLHMAPCC